VTGSADDRVALRRARDQDGEALRRLAELDSTVLPPGPLLLAEAGGDLLAAVSLIDGRAIADPFAPTAELVTLLRVRALQLRAHDAPRRSPARGRGLLARAARTLALLGSGGDRRAAAYEMSGRQAVLARALASTPRSERP
jgi:hypothetical protein